MIDKSKKNQTLLNEAAGLQLRKRTYSILVDTSEHQTSTEEERGRQNCTWKASRYKITFTFRGLLKHIGWRRETTDPPGRSNSFSPQIPHATIAPSLWFPRVLSPQVARVKFDLGMRSHCYPSSIGMLASIARLHSFSIASRRTV